MRITIEQQARIREITMATLRDFLTFHISHKAIDFIHEESTDDWSSFEDRLHNDYSIKGVGVIASRNNLKIIDAEDGGFLYLEEDLYPGEVSAELLSYPYVAASSSYLFTMLELYGDQLVNIVNPNYLRKHQAWHHGVYGDMSLKTKVERDNARKRFSKPFGRKQSSIPLYAVKRLIKLKKQRNIFIHEGQSEMEFNSFFANIIATVLSVYFLLAQNNNEIKLYPYYDYSGKWK